MTRRRQITFSLKTDSITKAIARIRDEEKWFTASMDQLLVRISTELQSQILANIAGTQIEVAHAKIVGKQTLPAYETRTPEVTTTIEKSGNIASVIIMGQDAVWVEFGTGVYYNGSPGTSPNPWGEKIGFTIGSYGSGNGVKRTWGYYSPEGGVNLTHGTKAQMPIYNACKDVAARFPSLVKEVFG